MGRFDVFFAHSKADGSAPDKAYALQDWMRKKTGKDYVVTSGVADWQKHFKDAGGWDGWCESVAQRYSVIVVPADPPGKTASIGMATYRIAQFAADYKKSVLLYLHGEGALIKAGPPSNVNMDDWRATAILGPA